MAFLSLHFCLENDDNLIMPQKTVLLVEDDLDVAESLLDLIVGWGYRCQHAVSFSEAVAKLSNQTFDLIILDIVLKNMSGLRAVDIVRQEGHPNKSTPILLHSANLDGNILRTYASEISEALVKPVPLIGLKEKMAYWSERRHVRSEAATPKRQFHIIIYSQDMVYALDVAKKMESGTFKTTVASDFHEIQSQINEQKVDCILVDSQADKSAIQQLSALPKTMSILPLDRPEEIPAFMRNLAQHLGYHGPIK